MQFLSTEGAGEVQAGVDAKDPSTCVKQMGLNCGKVLSSRKS